MKVYGHPMSTCTRKVLVALIETQTPYEFVLVDFAKGEHKQPPHLARQPFGQVPAIDDDGFAMYESRPITRYINDKAKGNLVPADLQGRARMEQWISIESADFTPHAMKFIFHTVFQRPQDEATLANASERLGVALGIMDAHLAAQPYFAGAAFSLADIAFMPYFEYVAMTAARDQLLKGSHVASWWNRVSERPSWRTVAGRA